MISSKRILAGILAAMLLFSSAQFPASIVYAEKLPLLESILEEESLVPGEETTTPEEEESAASKEESEPEQEENKAEQESKEEKTEAEQTEEEVSVSENDLSVSENNLQVSGNDLMSADESEIWVKVELKGAYQFGGAPASDGGITLYSESSYSHKELLDYLYQQMKARISPIDISGYDISGLDIFGMVWGTLNEHPDLYYVPRWVSFNGREISVGYDTTMDEKAWQRGVDAALASVDPGMSDLQKAIVLHDYLTINCEYDQEAASTGDLFSGSFSTYGVFAERTAVCQGYALAYKYLLNQLGIECYMVNSDEMNHAWNLVKLDGQYYQVDVTWDDPVWDLVGRACHNYMFLSDATFQDDDHMHHDWYVTYGGDIVDYTATDTRYENAFWTDCKSPLVFSGNDCYYISFDRKNKTPALKMTILNDLTADGVTLQKIDRWTLWKNSNGYYGDAFSGLFRIGDRLYFNDKAKIYSVTMDGKNKRTEFTANTTSGYIYGSAYYGGAVHYNLHQSPNLTAKEDVLTADIALPGTRELSESDTDVTLKADRFIYNGTEQEPKPVVLSSGVILKEGEDYELSYENNKNAGTATVTVDGTGAYYGSISRTYTIRPAALQIKAKDKTILIGDKVPAQSEYEYEVNGLAGTDALQTEPSLSCDVTDTTVAGQYEIIPSGADAGTNYTITYENGRLTVASEYVSCTVIFDVQGHGTAPKAQTGIKAGETAKKPENPEAVGYCFDGWYRDIGCTKVWDFDTDIVQEDMTLYAKWMRKSTDTDSIFTLQEIADVSYTGNACKPAVSVYDGKLLLKSGRDYQVKYYNNINANKDGVLKKGNGEGVDFNPELPYVEIIGKGNYRDKEKDGKPDTVKVNFNILRASIGDGAQMPTSGITLKASEQLTTTNKIQKPFSSIKYVKAMKRDTDFRLHLTVENARNQSGKSLAKDLELENAEIPAGYEGEFLLTVEGIGNYAGRFKKTIRVADKAHLIKNTSITLGKNQKNVMFAGKAVTLNPSETASQDSFTVKYGQTFLKPGRDYTVSYRNNDKVGKAELIITGNGEYVGTKTAAFTIKGKPFSGSTVQVDGLGNKVYTGRALTQNQVVLTYHTKDAAEETLRYGKDYTISYSKNINKGSATMTFKGVEKAGYSGSFKKTFRITAADLADHVQVERSDSMKNIVFPYCKAGAKPVDEIVLTNKEGFVLHNGKDYTLKYKNNKTVADASAEKPPTITVQGKGNYSGKFDVTFQITKNNLKRAIESESIQIKTTAVAYNPNKAEDYEYKPAVKLMDCKSALRAGTDYEIAYHKNKQKDYEDYWKLFETVRSRNENPDENQELQRIMPKAVITAKAGSNYNADEEIIVPLPIYQTKLVKRNLQIDVAEAVYTGSQVMPVVTVYDTNQKRLVNGKDYTVSYGANDKSGKNKGSVTITGISPAYGGSVTVKFNVERKPIVY